MDHVVIQITDFDISAEYNALTRDATCSGAVVLFTGLVRDFNQGEQILELELEHYPGMTEKALAKIVVEAEQRWPLLKVEVLHRIGALEPGEPIVFVGVASAHRQAAFDACNFIMDYLKTRAPFWKKEHGSTGASWVEGRASDQQAAQRWQDETPS